jgi:hypothetical protein
MAFFVESWNAATIEIVVGNGLRAVEGLRALGFFATLRMTAETCSGKSNCNTMAMATTMAKATATTTATAKTDPLLDDNQKGNRNSKACNPFQYQTLAKDKFALKCGVV